MNTRYGAGDRTRTGTLSPAVDFESTTSTNSITPAGASVLYNSFLKIARGKFRFANSLLLCYTLFIRRCEDGDSVF